MLPAFGLLFIGDVAVTSFFDITTIAEPAHTSTTLGGDGFELGAPFQFQAGQDRLHALLSRQLSVIVVELQSREGVLLTRRVLSTTRAVLVLKQDRDRLALVR